MNVRMCSMVQACFHNEAQRLLLSGSRQLTMRKTVCDLLLPSFILVAPMCLLASPSDSSCMTCSTDTTMSSRSPATYTPASLLSWMGSLRLSGASRSLMSSLYSCGGVQHMLAQCGCGMLWLLTARCNAAAITSAGVTGCDMVHACSQVRYLPGSTAAALNAFSECSTSLLTCRPLLAIEGRWHLQTPHTPNNLACALQVIPPCRTHAAGTPCPVTAQ